MDHADHVALIEKGIHDAGKIWADFGSGSGAFTLALAELIGPNGIIYSIDQDIGALRQQERRLKTRFPSQIVHFIHQDFSKPLDLPPLDGVVMANALHFIRDKSPVLQLILNYLRPNGRLILVEYNVDRGNLWVPHPLSFPAWLKLAERNGFTETRLLASRPSHFLKEIYSALSIAPQSPVSI